MGVQAVWVQRFAIITFRACRFVCINSVRQFPLCGVHSRERISSSTPSCLCFPPASSLVDGLARRTKLERTACLGSLEKEKQGDPFQEGSAIRESVNASFSPLSFRRPFVTLLAATLSHVCTRSLGSASVSS